MTEEASQVNLHLIFPFDRKHIELVPNNYVATEGTNNEVINCMFVPVIQGTIKYVSTGEM